MRSAVPKTSWRGQLRSYSDGHPSSAAHNGRADTSESAGVQLLDQLGEAVDQLGAALASLGEAYEQVDEHTAELLEEQMFRPVQGAYGRGRRTHSEFAKRYSLSARSFVLGSPG